MKQFYQLTAKADAAAFSQGRGNGRTSFGTRQRIKTFEKWEHGTSGTLSSRSLLPGEREREIVDKKDVLESDRIRGREMPR